MAVKDAMHVLRQLFAAYPNSQATEQTIAVYLRLLQDISPNELQTIVDQCIAQYKFLPTVAELRDMHHTLTVGLLQPTAAEAWGEVRRQITSVTHLRKPQFDDPLIDKAVGILGWQDLCQSENPIADRARFLQIYGQLEGRQEQGDKLLPPARRLMESRHPKQLEHIANILATEATNG